MYTLHLILEILKPMTSFTYTELSMKHDYFSTYTFTVENIIENFVK